MPYKERHSPNADRCRKRWMTFLVSVMRKDCRRSSKKQRRSFLLLKRNRFYWCCWGSSKNQRSPKAPRWSTRYWKVETKRVPQEVEPKESHGCETRAQLEGDTAGLHSERKKAIEKRTSWLPQNWSSRSTKRSNEDNILQQLLSLRLS